MRSLSVYSLSFMVLFSAAYSASDLTNKNVVAEILGLMNGGKKNVITDLIINKLLNIYAPVLGDSDNELCRKHGIFYKESVKKGELWALKMLDSSSKFPEGILMGNLVQLGNFDECLNVEDVPSDFGAFSGQHCLVSVSQSGESVSQRSIVEMVKEISLDAVRADRNDADHLEKSDLNSGRLGLPLQWSICVPSSCRAKDVQQHLQSALPDNLTVKVTDTNCNSKATNYPFSPADWFAVAFMSFFALLVILSTSYDLLNLNSESRQPMLAAFSVYSNGIKILSSPTKSPDNLTCLHGVRFLSMAWVVLGHRYLFDALTPSINRFVIFGHAQDWSHIFVTNATISVDSFFLISGILVCYIFMKEMEKGTSFNVLLYFIHRYIRLTPPYAVVILLSATLFAYLGDGPFWQSAGALGRDSCQRNWWINLLYLNNYVRPNEQCVGQSWYIAVDMQLFWLSPLVLLPLLKWPKVGKPLLGGFIGAGLLIAFLVPYLYEFRFSTIVSSITGPMQYYPTHTRLTPWLIGIGFGYILHTTKNSTLRLSKRIVALGWFLSFGLMLTSLLLAHRFFQFDHHYERAFESIYTCLMRPAWALGLALLIFACVKGYGGFINTFLSWSVFQVLGRLTYTVYLIHFNILIWIYASVKEPLYVNDRTVFMQHFADMVISFSAAFVLSVVFESPAIVIEKHFLGKLSRQRGRAKMESDDENIFQNDVGKDNIN